MNTRILTGCRRCRNPHRNDGYTPDFLANTDPYLVGPRIPLSVQRGQPTYETTSDIVQHVGTNRWVGDTCLERLAGGGSP